MSTDLERAAEYRAQAAETLGLAEESLEQGQRQRLLNLALIYHRLAEQLEEIHRQGDKPSE